MKSTFWTISVALVLSFSHFLSGEAQNIKWYNPQDAGFLVVRGQAFPQDNKGNYRRFPDYAQEVVPNGVWWNSKYSAGLSVRFRTQSSRIQIRYGLVDMVVGMLHMPATGKSGMDMYEIDENGKDYYCMPNFDFSFGDTCRFTFDHLDHSYSGEYEVYLPLYNEVTWMEVGVPDGQELTFCPLPEKKPILVYGTSIAHGGCASRTGMAWPTLVKRATNRPLINWGFSGSGRLEEVMFKELMKVDACLYIIDCMPNMDGIPEEIVPRMTKGIRMLREKTDAPILIAEHDRFSGDMTSSYWRNEYERANKECRHAYELLKKEGVKKLYYLSCEEIGMPLDALVDGCHSTDYGMISYANAYMKKIKKILKK